MGTSRDDIRYALRRIRREPAFAAFAVAIMAIGVAAVTAVFSVMSPLMLRPLPFAHQERLVWIAGEPGGGLSSVTSRAFNLRDYRTYSRSFEAITGFGAFFDYGGYNLVGDGPPERLVGVGVVQNFLPVLGVPLLLGRNFTDEESVWNGRRAAILTHGFWTRRFGADAAIVGRSITLNGEPTEVVGVLPEWFDFASTFAPSSRVDFLTTFPVSEETDQNGNTLSMIGRLEPGVTVASAQADLDRVNKQLQEADPKRWGLRATVSGLRDHLAGSFRAPFLVLAVAAALVLAVACGNLSNLLLVRAQQRAREMSVRSALGATRRRLVVQLLTESLLLATAGGALGVGLAFWITRWVSATTAVSIPMLPAVSVDASALGFTLVATLVTGLVVGIAPALQLSQGREWATLNEASRGSSGSRRSNAVRETLVVGEVALAFVLLVGGTLLLRSLWQTDVIASQPRTVWQRQHCLAILTPTLIRDIGDATIQRARRGRAGGAGRIRSRMHARESAHARARGESTRRQAGRLPRGVRERLPSRDDVRCRGRGANLCRPRLVSAVLGVQRRCAW